jgi:putative FmdB family regulatory protein
MPIYEYRCESCEKSTEVMQKSTDPAPAQCETCGKGPMVKQLSMSSFALKGTGWYVTDFKGGSGQKAPASSES